MVKKQKRKRKFLELNKSESIACQLKKKKDLTVIVKGTWCDYKSKNDQIKWQPPASQGLFRGTHVHVVISRPGDWPHHAVEHRGESPILGFSVVDAWCPVPPLSNHFLGVPALIPLLCSADTSSQKPSETPPPAHPGFLSSLHSCGPLRCRGRLLCL